MSILPVALLFIAAVGLPLIYYLGRKRRGVYEERRSLPQELRHGEPLPSGRASPYRPGFRRTSLAFAFAFDPRITMQIVLSLALVSASLFVILAERYDPNSKHWAFGTLGTIMGFWLRGAR